MGPLREARLRLGSVDLTLLTVNSDKKNGQIIDLPVL